jgi:hypothetical protein
MRKYLLFPLAAVVAVLFTSLFFNAKNVSAQTDNAVAMDTSRHERADREKAQQMMRFYVSNSNKRDHKFTKFNRQDLIDALQAMPDVDTVKFVIGATIDNTTDIPRGKPVIMLQVQQPDGEQPGGHTFLAYSYMVGAICPPPYGKDCVLEK